MVYMYVAQVGCLHAVVQLPLSVAAAIGGSPENAPHGAIMMWPLCAVKVGEELTRDCVPGPRSLQRAAAVLTLLSSPRHDFLPLPGCEPLQRGLHSPRRIQEWSLVFVDRMCPPGASQ